MIEHLELDPTVIAVECDAGSISCKPLVYKLRHRDTFIINYVAFKKTFGMPIRRIKLGEKFNPHFICMEKIKRKHWWQFWKPKYIGAKIMYV